MPRSSLLLVDSSCGVSFELLACDWSCLCAFDCDTVFAAVQPSDVSSSFPTQVDMRSQLDDYERSLKEARRAGEHWARKREAAQAEFTECARAPSSLAVCFTTGAATVLALPPSCGHCA